MVRKTGLHPHDPGCQQASAEVSSSKTLTPHQLPAAVLQPSSPSDLTLSEEVGFPVGSAQDCIIYLKMLMAPSWLRTFIFIAAGSYLHALHVKYCSGRVGSESVQ